MTFIEWTKTEDDSNQNAPNPKTMKTRQERDRLNRMEAMLHELVLLKKILTEAKTFQPQEKSHAKK
jgi:hypothetical protein